MFKRISKILTAIVMVMAFMVSAFQPALFTGGVVKAKAKSKYSVEVALYLQESNDNWSFGKEDPKTWSEPKSKSVKITKDGTYTLTLKNLDIPADKLTLCYIKDVAAYDASKKKKTYNKSNLPSNLKVVTNVFKLNGSSKTIKSTVRTGLKKGIFDVAYHNDWTPSDCNVDIFGTVTSIEVTFTVSGITGKPGAFKYKAK